MASSYSSPAKSLFQSLKRFFKKPWEITGPCSDPEYRSALPSALEYRCFCPATPPAEPCVPTADPAHVFDIQYYTRDCRHNRPPPRRTVLRKPDVEKMMAGKTFGPAEFPRVVELATTPGAAGTRNRPTETISLPKVGF